MEKGKFNTVVDSAWGSSGKGAASTRLADIHGVKHLSSCNFPNAGHTVIIDEKKFIFKVLPSGAALLPTRKKNVELWVGPNSGFKLEQFQAEVEWTGFQVGTNLHVHDRAVLVTDDHVAQESPGGTQSTLHISSTMSGSGAAFTAKAMRKKELETAKHAGIGIDNWKFYQGLQDGMARGETALHEVSQGFALSINHGTHYPQCTFRDSTPQQAYADFGITKSAIGDVYLNVRSFPIRVGNNYDANGVQIGYSGDGMSDGKELSWEQVAKLAGMPDDEAQALAERERTTVTKKIRRVFEPSWELLSFSARFCGATKLVLNFPQYIHWSAHKVRGGNKEFLKMHPSVLEYVEKMQDVTNLPVVLIGTGADHDDYVYLG